MKLPKGPTVTTQQLKTILGVLFFLTLLVLHNNVVSLHIASLRASQQYEEATADRIKKERFVTNRLKAKRVELKKLLEEHGTHNSILFTEEEAQTFFKNLEAMCVDAGCEVTSVGYRLPDRDDSITTPDESCVIVRRTAGLEVLGQYGGIIDLVKALDTAVHKVWLDTFHLSADGSNAGLIRCHITLTVFVSQMKEKMGDGNATE